MAPHQQPPPASTGPSNVDESADAAPTAPEPKSILYCPHCTLPPEYCQFASSASKCQKWLVETHPELAEKIYGSSSTGTGESSAATAANVTTPAASAKSKEDGPADGSTTTTTTTGLEKSLEEGLTLKQKEDEDKEREKKERREQRKLEKEERERKSAKIVLTKHSRTKKKVTTVLSGLEHFTPPLPALKVISKGLSSRLATGCSVSKSTHNPNLEEITIQGDVAEDVKEMILAGKKPFEGLQVTADQVKIEEDKKKKATEEKAAE